MNYNYFFKFFNNAFKIKHQRKLHHLKTFRTCYNCLYYSTNNKKDDEFTQNKLNEKFESKLIVYFNNFKISIQMKIKKNQLLKNIKTS